MSVASVPFLVTIISALGTMLKAIWEIAARAATRAALLFGTVVPMVLRWFLTFRGFTLALCVFLGIQVAAVMRLAFRLTQDVLQASGSLAFLNAHFKWMFFIFWDGPMNVKHLYSVCVPDILGVWAGICAVKLAFRKVAWIKFLATQKMRGGAP